MTFYRLTNATDSTLATDTPVIKQADIDGVANAADLIDLLEAERAELAAARAETLAAAHAEGLELGREEGKRAGETALTEKLMTLDTAARARDVDTAQQSKALAIEIVRRIAGKMADSELVSALAEQAVQTLEPAGPILVRVSPANAEAVTMRLTALDAPITVEADTSLGPHDCLIANALGQIDGGLETQLTAIENILIAGGAHGG